MSENPENPKNPEPQTSPQTTPAQTNPLVNETPKKSSTPIFHLGLKAKPLLAILSAIAVLVDEATFMFSAGNISLRAMDPSRIAMVVFNYPKEAFDIFSVDREGKITFDVGEVIKILKRADKEDLVELAMTDKESLLPMKVKLDTKKRLSVFDVPILESEQEDLPEPKISFETNVKITSEGLKSAVEDVSIVSDHVEVLTTPDMFRMKAAGEVTKADIKFAKGVSEALLDVSKQDLNLETRAVFSLEYFREIVKGLGEVADILEVSYAKEMPIKLEAQGTKGSMRFFQAPRIEVE